jgi:hypothetical protein
MSSPPSRAPLVSSVLLTLVGTVAQSADKLLPPALALGLAGPLGCGLAAAGQLGGNVLASFLYERFTSRKQTPEDIARNGRLRDLVARAIRGTVESQISLSAVRDRKSYISLARAAEKYWPILFSEELPREFAELAPDALPTRVSETFSGNPTTIASADEWSGFLAEAAKLDDLVIEPAVIADAAAALHQRLGPYLGDLVVTDSPENHESYGKLVLRMLSELLVTVKQHQGELEKLQQQGGVPVSDFLRDVPALIIRAGESLEHLQRKADEISGDIRIISGQLESLLTAESLDKLSKGGRKGKKEAARLVSELARQTRRSQEWTEAAILRFGETLAAGEAARDRETSAQAGRAALLVRELRRHDQTAHIVTRRWIAWTATLAAVLIITGMVMGNRKTGAQLAQVQLVSRQLDEKVTRIYEASKQEAVSSLAGEEFVPLGFAKLSELTGYSETEIRGILATGKRSSDPVISAMAHYAAGEISQARKISSQAIQQRETGARAVMTELGHLRVIKALSLLKEGSQKEALAEFRLAWTSHAAVGNTEEVFDTKLLAAASLLQKPEVDHVHEAIRICIDAFGASDEDDQGMFNLFASTGCVPSDDFAGTIGWLNHAEMSDDKKQFVISGEIFVGYWKSLERKPGFHFETSDVSVQEPRPKGKGAQTTPVGHLLVPAGFLRKSLPILEEAMSRLEQSPYFGTGHPYMFLLYVNACELSYAIGDPAKVRAYSKRFCDLAKILVMENRLPAGIILMPDFARFFNKLRQEGFLPADVSSRPGRLTLSISRRPGFVLVEWMHDSRDLWASLWAEKIEVESRIPPAEEWTPMGKFSASFDGITIPYPMRGEGTFEMDYRARHLSSDAAGEWSEIVRAKLVSFVVRPGHPPPVFAPPLDDAR